jgi:hypothetical protein
MGLGARNAHRHDTVGVQKHAVVSADYADFRVGQRVMTVDGLPGTVAAIDDGPYPGTESYRIELDNGLGGGAYRTADLRELRGHTAGEHHQAADDYPELGDILSRRPDIATE